MFFFFFFIAEFERAAKIRKIAFYRFLISFLVPERKRNIGICHAPSKMAANFWKMADCRFYGRAKLPNNMYNNDNTDNIAVSIKLETYAYCAVSLD